MKPGNKEAASLASAQAPAAILWAVSVQRAQLHSSHSPFVPTTALSPGWLLLVSTGTSGAEIHSLAAHTYTTPSASAASGSAHSSARDSTLQIQELPAWWLLSLN